MLTPEEQILAKALAAYHARVTDVSADVGAGIGTPQAALEIVDDPLGGKKLAFTFDNIRGNGITSLTIGASGADEGKITISYLDGATTVFTGLADAIAYLRSVCWVSNFADDNSDGHVYVTVAAS